MSLSNVDLEQVPEVMWLQVTVAMVTVGTHRQDGLNHLRDTERLVTPYDGVSVVEGVVAFQDIKEK